MNKIHLYKRLSTKNSITQTIEQLISCIAPTLFFMAMLPETEALESVENTTTTNATTLMHLQVLDGFGDMAICYSMGLAMAPYLGKMIYVSITDSSKKGFAGNAEMGEIRHHNGYDYAIGNTKDGSVCVEIYEDRHDQKTKELMEAFSGFRNKEKYLKVMKDYMSLTQELAYLKQASHVVVGPTRPYNSMFATFSFLRETPHYARFTEWGRGKQSHLDTDNFFKMLYQARHKKTDLDRILTHLGERINLTHPQVYKRMSEDLDKLRDYANSITKALNHIPKNSPLKRFKKAWYSSKGRGIPTPPKAVVLFKHIIPEFNRMVTGLHEQGLKEQESGIVKSAPVDADFNFADPRLAKFMIHPGTGGYFHKPSNFLRLASFLAMQEQDIILGVAPLDSLFNALSESMVTDGTSFKKALHHKLSSFITHLSSPSYLQKFLAEPSPDLNDKAFDCATTLPEMLDTAKGVLRDSLHLLKAQGIGTVVIALQNGKEAVIKLNPGRSKQVHWFLYKNLPEEDLIKIGHWGKRNQLPYFTAGDGSITKAVSNKLPMALEIINEGDCFESLQSAYRNMQSALSNVQTLKQMSGEAATLNPTQINSTHPEIATLPKHCQVAFVKALSLKEAGQSGLISNVTHEAYLGKNLGPSVAKSF